MAEHISVGSVSVDVVPNAERFAKDLHAKLDPQSRQIGDELGKIMGRALADKISDGVGSGLRDGHTGEAELEGGKAGRGFADEFSRVAQQRIRAAFRALPKADLNVDSTEAQARIAEMRAQLSTLSKDISLGVDDKEAIARLAALAEFMKRTLKDAADVRVKVDVGKALVEVEALKKALGHVEDTGKRGFLSRLLSPLTGGKTLAGEVANAAGGGGSSGGGGGGGTSLFNRIIDTGGQGLSGFGLAVVAIIANAPALYNALIVVAAGIAGLAAAISVATLGLGAVLVGGIAAFQFISGNSAKLTTAQKGLTKDKAKLAADQLKKPGASTSAAIKLDELNIGKDQASIAKITKRLGPDGVAAANGMKQLSAEWQNFGKAVLPLVLPILVTGLKILNQFLPSLEPIVKTVSPVIVTMMQNVGKALNGPAGKAFMAFIAKQAPALVKDIGDIIGHVVGFLTSFIVGFTPIGKQILDWLDHVTSNLGGFSRSKGFQQFLADVKADTPSVLNFFRQVGKLVGNLILDLEALQPVGRFILNVWADVVIPAIIILLHVITQSILTVFILLGKGIGGFLTGLGDVMSALHLPFAAAVKGAAKSVTDWTNSMQTQLTNLQNEIYGVNTALDKAAKPRTANFTLTLNGQHVSEHGGAGKALTAAMVVAATKNYKSQLVGQSTGGLVTGAGTATSDSIPRALSNGEYVVKAASVAKYGSDMLRAINDGQFRPSTHRSLEVNVEGYGAHEVASLIVHKQQQYELLHAER